MQIGIGESIHDAMYFSLGALLVEMIYVRLALVGMDWVRKRERLMKAMEWITLGIIVTMAIGSFIAAAKGGGHAENIVLQNNMHRFFLGMLMSGTNPMVIPFWFGWSSVLLQKKILEPSALQYNYYIVGIGTGTFLGNCIFIFGGQWIVNKIANSQQYMNWVIGGIFAITAIIQLFKMMQHKDPISKLNEKIEDNLNS
jgi:threonine/homoserine/homoserine lactone efflux protein